MTARELIAEVLQEDVSRWINPKRGEQFHRLARMLHAAMQRVEDYGHREGLDGDCVCGDAFTECAWSSILAAIEAECE